MSRVHTSQIPQEIYAGKVITFYQKFMHNEVSGDPASLPLQQFEFKLMKMNGYLAPL